MRFCFVLVAVMCSSFQAHASACTPFKMDVLVCTTPEDQHGGYTRVSVKPSNRNMFELSGSQVGGPARLVREIAPVEVTMTYAPEGVHYVNVKRGVELVVVVADVAGKRMEAATFKENQKAAALVMSCTLEIE
jgi:hypothetical protein